MSKSNGFQFKQFFVAHDKCAMKVNTDGILLGAVADIRGANHILDLGTGTGLVAMMLAQRSDENCHIFALELEPNAYQQAVENVENSQWANRIQVVQGDVMTAEFSLKFDLIVSNPPYFSDSLKTRNEARDLARTTVQSHLAWLEKAQNWLTKTGKITFILPFEAGEKLIAESALCCVEKWAICTKAGNAPKRMIATFSPNFTACNERTLAIYDQQHRYIEEFKALTHDFYLKM